MALCYGINDIIVGRWIEMHGYAQFVIQEYFFSKSAPWSLLSGERLEIEIDTHRIDGNVRYFSDC